MNLQPKWKTREIKFLVVHIYDDEENIIKEYKIQGVNSILGDSKYENPEEARFDAKIFFEKWFGVNPGYLKLYFDYEVAEFSNQ